MGGEAAGARYDHIDALRAIAALLVVWLHAEQFLLIAGPTAFGKWYIDPGRAGVVLFFAISGFVIPPSLRGTPANGTRSFLIRRFFRLYPAYWLSIPIGWIAIHSLSGEPFAVLPILANTTMLQELFGIPDVIGTYWTLPIELGFYATCLTLFWCQIVHRSMTFCVLTALTALGAWCYMRLGYHVLAAEQRFPQSPDFWYRIGRYVVADPRNLWSDFRFLWLVFLSIMGLGALLRFWHDGKAGKFDKFFILSAVGCWSIFCIVVPLERHIRGVMSLGDVSTYLSHGVPVVAFFILSCFWKMHSRILSYLGLISYSLYLFHLTLIVPLGYFLKQHPQSVPRSTPDSLLVIAAVFLSIGAAAVIFVLIEKPAIDLSHRLANIQVGEPAHEA